MLKIIDDDIMCCADCIMIIANDDASGLDYYLESDAAEERESHIRQSILDLESSVINGHLVCGDSDKDEEFSNHTCDVCGSVLAGTKHNLVLLGE